MFGTRASPQARNNRVVTFQFSHPVKAEQRDVEALIRDVFLGVSREGGVSWSQADAIDNGADDLTEQRARASDTEAEWIALVDNPKWNPEAGSSRFSFLDAIGFRYYLAPAMIRAVRQGSGGFLQYILLIDDKLRRQQISAVSASQSRAVVRFIRLMIEMDRAHGAEETEQWNRALAHWQKIE